jgi:hypothetical protein
MSNAFFEDCQVKKQLQDLGILFEVFLKKNFKTQHLKDFPPLNVFMILSASFLKNVTVHSTGLFFLFPPLLLYL